MRKPERRWLFRVVGPVVGAVAAYWLVVWIATAAGADGGAARWLAWVVVALIVFGWLSMWVGSPFNRESGVTGDPYARRDWRRDPLNPNGF